MNEGHKLIDQFNSAWFPILFAKKYIEPLFTTLKEVFQLIEAFI